MPKFPGKYKIFNKIKWIIILLFILIIRGESQDSPNVLLIIGDDMGVDVLNGYEIGSDLPQTPNIDSLRTNGLTFRNVWSAPVCSATRAAIMTGKYGINNGVNSVPGILSTEQISIFKELDNRTNNLYNFCVVGKWHLSNRNDLDHPFTHGVDQFMGVMGGGVEDYYQWSKVEEHIQSTSSSYATTYFTDYAAQWINTQSQPWLMWLAHVAPHTPYHTPPDGMYSQTTTNSQRKKYLAMIESLDFEIGRLLNAIPNEVLENTIIIFLGDNGTPNNMLQTFPNGHGKGSIYQGGINVPLIVSGKGVTRINETEDALINVTDLFATIAHIADPSNVGKIHDSYSFNHLLDGSGGINRNYNYMEIGSNDEDILEDRYTVRDTDYKLIKTGENEELYHLTSDPYELNNLLGNDLTENQQSNKARLDSVLNSILGIDDDTTTSSDGKAYQYPIVHTDVREFYTNNDILTEDPEPDQILHWQDAGRIINSPVYTNNGDGSITDEVTGLIWEQNMGEKITLAEALIKADTSTLGGYNDWRIPSIKELYSLILFTGQVRGENAIISFLDTDSFDQPLGNENIGEREIDAQTWSNTYYTGLTMNGDTTIFGVNFIDGRIKGYPKFKPGSGAPNELYFRMVRGNTYYGKNLFYDNNDGTVTDSSTMLMWQQADDGNGRDWLSSIEYCENLILGGHDNWHLPHAKELHSIVDYNRSPTATQSPAIDPVFITSEVLDPDGNPGHFPHFWSSSPHLDGVNPYASAVYVAFGKALGKINNQLLDVHGAGSQRSDPKTGNMIDYPQYHGPQGDVQIVYNHCRCVRNIEDTTTSISSLPKENIKLYPIPANDNLTIDIPYNMPATMRLYIYDLGGKQVLSKSISNGLTLVDIQSLLPGFYIAVISGEGVIPFSYKMVKGR